MKHSPANRAVMREKLAACLGIMALMAAEALGGGGRHDTFSFAPTRLFPYGPRPPSSSFFYVPDGGRPDPADSPDFLVDAEAQEGTLEAALHALWSHRNGAYGSPEEKPLRADAFGLQEAGNGGPGPTTFRPRPQDGEALRRRHFPPRRRRPPAGGDLGHRPGPRRRVQVVRQRLPVGRVGFLAPEKDVSQPTTFQQTEYQDIPSVSQSSFSPYVGMGASNALGQQDHYLNKENTQTGLTLAEVIELREFMDLPLEKKTLLLEKDSISDNRKVISVLQQQNDGTWLSRVGQVVAGVSQQLPSIDQAVTTMSFLAFGVFMANLVVQAVANSSSLSSLLGRDVGSFTWLPLYFPTLPPSVRSLEMGLNLGENIQDDLDNRIFENVVDAISQVYISLHEMARVGVSHIVSALGMEVLKSRVTPEIAELEPDCLHRLLCEGHRVTSPFFKDNMSYRLLPFWTMGVSWLSGESSVPKLLEDLRAEVAGQQGLNCESLFPECHNAENVEVFLTQVKSEMAYNNPALISDHLIENGQARTTGIEERYTKYQYFNATDDNLKSSVTKRNVK